MALCVRLLMSQGAAATHRYRRPCPSIVRRTLSSNTDSSSSTSDKTLHQHGSLLLQSRDTLGIVSAVSDVVLKHGLNMTGADLHIEKGRTLDSSSNNRDNDTFVCRFSFQTNQNGQSFAFDDADSADSFNLQSFEEHIRQVSTTFHANATLLHQSGRLVQYDATQKSVLRCSGPARMAIFASKRDHCLNDLIDKCRGGDLPVTISYVISNYDRTEDCSHVYRGLSRLGIPYFYVPTKDRQKDQWEGDIQSIIDQENAEAVAGTDFIVLARYMQILSPEFLSWYAPRPIVNIHHGLLPSFKGSNPYRQAYDAGVKLIGATAHFVTAQLDEGPILTQTAAPVSHRDGVRDVRIKSETLEANALHDAVRCLAENRVARVGGRTIVFT